MQIYSRYYYKILLILNIYDKRKNNKNLYNIILQDKLKKFYKINKNLLKKVIIIYKYKIKRKKKKLKPEGNSPSNADKSPVERLSLNRS